MISRPDPAPDPSPRLRIQTKSMETTTSSVEPTRLLIFCDGARPESYSSRTGEDFGKGEEEIHGFGLSSSSSQYVCRTTNVSRLSQCIKPLSRDKIRQIVMYQSINIHPQLSVNTVRVKIAEKIWEIYDYIAHNYSPGDQVYLFGISQGAFIARKVASLLGALGILPGEEMELFFRHWHTSNQSHTSQPEQKIEIEFLGLWDSAGLDHLWYGTQELVDFLGVKNNSLPDCVKRVRHVMAYHERSDEFSTYTSVQADRNDQRVAQVWFPGTRQDVGEVCKFHQISDITLLWMAGEIQDAGVELDMTYLRVVISQAAGTGLEVHDTSFPEAWDSKKATKLWEIEGRDEPFQTSMSNASTYCHRSMWAPLARLFRRHPTGPHDGYCPAYWVQPVPLSSRVKPRELNALEQLLWAGRWENTIPDPENPKNPKQSLGRGIQKTSRPLQREPVNIENIRLLCSTRLAKPAPPRGVQKLSAGLGGWWWGVPDWFKTRPYPN